MPSGSYLAAISGIKDTCENQEVKIFINKMINFRQCSLKLSIFFARTEYKKHPIFGNLLLNCSLKALEFNKKYHKTVKITLKEDRLSKI